MTPECKILFPDLPPYNVAFAPTVPGTQAYTILIEGYQDPFVEYCKPLPNLRYSDTWTEPKVYNYTWKPGYVPSWDTPSSNIVLYSDCPSFVLEPDIWKPAVLQYKDEHVCNISIRVTSVSRSSNPYSGVPYLYEYAFTMEISA